MQRSRATLPLLISVVAVDLVGFGIVVPVLPYWAKALNASGFELGLLISGYAAAQFLCAPLWGRLSDRIGRRPVMLFTIAGTSLSLLALGLAGSLAGLFAARFCAGAFAANVSVASAWIGDVTTPEERTTWMGRVGACFAIGFTLGPALGGPLGSISYATPMFFAAGLAAANLVLAAFVLREPTRNGVGAGAEEDAAGGGGKDALSAGAPGAPMRTGLAGLLQNRVLMRLCIAYLVFSLAITQLESMFQYLVIDLFGWSLLTVSLVLVLMAVWTGGIQGGAMRPLSKRYAERGLVLSGALLLAAGFVLLPMAPGAVPGFMLLLAVLATGRGIAQPALMGMASQHADPARLGAAMGVFQSSASLARVFGPAAAGRLFDIAPALPFWLAGVLMLVVAFLARALPGRSTAPPGADASAGPDAGAGTGTSTDAGPDASAGPGAGADTSASAGPDASAGADAGASAAPLPATRS